MLYLRNTNKIQSISQQVDRGPAGAIATISSSISASYTTATSSLFVLLSDGVTKLSTTSSASTNFQTAFGGIVSASIAGTTPSSSIAISLSISASDASYYFTGSSTGSGVMTSFAVGSNITYTISSSISVTTGSVPTSASCYYGIGGTAGNPGTYSYTPCGGTATTESLSANTTSSVTCIDINQLFSTSGAGGQVFRSPYTCSYVLPGTPNPSYNTTFTVDAGLFDNYHLASYIPQGSTVYSFRVMPLNSSFTVCSISGSNFLSKGANVPMEQGGTGYTITQGSAC